MNPQRYLIPAVLAALNASPLPGGATAREYLPEGFNEPAYVLVTQPTVAPAAGAARCKAWSCTLLLDCITLHTPGAVSAVLVDEVADEVLARLDGQRLPLGGGLQMGPATLDLLNSGEGEDGEQIDVHRYVRLRFSIYLNT